MAIYDTNHQGEGRPNPTNHDVRIRRHADSTQSITNKLDEDTGARVETRDGYITVFDGTDNRVIMGLLPDGEYGIVVTKVGEDAFDVFS